MSKARTLLVVIFCGFIPMLFNRIVDGEWPSYSATRWLVFLAGLAVIAVGAVLLDSRLAARKRDSADVSS